MNTCKSFTVVSINIEGFSQAKACILSQLECDVLCVQETHRSCTQSRPEIPGFILVLESPHPKYGSAIYTKPGLSVDSTDSVLHNSTEVLTIIVSGISITSVYKPPRQLFSLPLTKNFYDANYRIVVGDFNSHSTIWGYKKTDRNGKAVVYWAEEMNLSLLHSDELPSSFFSCRWKSGYNPDLMFVSDNITFACFKDVGLTIPKTQHRPIICHFTYRSDDDCIDTGCSLDGLQF